MEAPGLIFYWFFFFIRLCVCMWEKARGGNLLLRFELYKNKYLLCKKTFFTYLQFYPIIIINWNSTTHHKIPQIKFDLQCSTNKTRKKKLNVFILSLSIFRFFGWKLLIFPHQKKAIPVCHQHAVWQETLIEFSARVYLIVVIVSTYICIV